MVQPKINKTVNISKYNKVNIQKDDTVKTVLLHQRRVTLHEVDQRYTNPRFKRHIRRYKTIWNKLDHFPEIYRNNLFEVTNNEILIRFSGVLICSIIAVGNIKTFLLPY